MGQILVKRPKQDLPLALLKTFRKQVARNTADDGYTAMKK
jgi:hypothetical protein